MPTETRAKIILGLAKWLLGPDAIQPSRVHGAVILYSWTGATRKFDPFEDSNSGRQQFAECLIKATQAGLNPYLSTTRADAGKIGRSVRVEHDNTAQGITAATLEAIYLAVAAEKGN